MATNKKHSDIRTFFPQPSSSNGATHHLSLSPSETRSSRKNQSEEETPCSFQGDETIKDVPMGILAAAFFDAKKTFWKTKDSKALVRVKSIENIEGSWSSHQQATFSSTLGLKSEAKYPKELQNHQNGNYENGHSPHLVLDLHDCKVCRNSIVTWKHKKQKTKPLFRATMSSRHSIETNKNQKSAIFGRLATLSTHPKEENFLIQKKREKNDVLTSDSQKK